ncbi:Cof-type HAD-IIB family hydrolase [Lactiplantibacillus mudanjiangensis]|uniref:HAD superfamily hydrolase [Lactobacillus plantarum JDM1] n=1 Tax=Lactiplantibacillus mudanjiangensis TaxID=1296538 RepID=A0A660E8W5_9LACO|nr:Cof-type HAD-IIB family hydrolase [Lactiplantibacillus mudanjiangensis]VDG20500.1 HAD superfamily hydrolase [Lactobacillus plantarum JDM1] [Lactiplantibacillus mudanjiangensis]VDG24274.1 HAD superfamily hydrolase [Lactobacillus plantarum JDM1] [Lactiplantibacillus mudanjiangensis]VDG30463.1 HAD superfamily hydrolase [Lactobacillus plantarum JDM1] [Lactiplantibacillus mudanjiangensis]VDG30762.1 HAD superfamily hydrolase [Lactobacillus plantarum JDM1] [Lactiplantibacillus mudanjiangensis]
MKVALIASDLDGTFLRDDHQFDRSRFQAQLDQLNTQGQHFVVASGNQLQHCIDVFEGIDGELTYVAENGGLVIDNHGHVLHESVVTPPLLTELLQLVQTEPALRGAGMSLSGKNGAYIRPVDDNAVMRYFLSDIRVVSDLNDVDDHIYKATFSWDDRDINAQAAIINTHFAGRLRATVSGGNGLDVINPTVNKAAGLAYLQQRWQIPSSKTAVFGDNGNDLEMLREADYSYAMKNAIAPVKAAAAYQTQLDNNHDGVLHTIDQLIN